MTETQLTFAYWLNNLPCGNTWGLLARVDSPMPILIPLKLTACSPAWEYSKSNSWLNVVV